MTPTRRQYLQGVCAGVGLTLIGSPTSAGPTERFFVHPRTGIIGDAISAIEAIGGTIVFEYDNFDFVVAEIPDGEQDTLLDDFRISLIERDDDVGIPSDWFPSLSDILGPGENDDCSTHPDQRSSWGWERIGADGLEASGSTVDIGILDTGIQSNHCSLSVAGGRNFSSRMSPSDYEDRHGHGTHVAGVASALDNDLGVIGVAPGANLYAIKVLDDRGSGQYSSLVAGIDWCLSNDIELISMSLGGDEESVSVDQAIEEATAAGHLLLCAAGNEGNDGQGCSQETMTYPATHPDVIATTAMNEDESLASYSSVGTAIDLLAPGSDIISTYVGNEYASASGTSMACPFATGVAALVWSNRGEAGPGPNQEVRTILEESAETVLDSCEEGHGLVSASAAVRDERATEGNQPRDDGTEIPGDREDRDDRHSADDGSPTIFQWFLDLLLRLFEIIANLFR